MTTQAEAYKRAGCPPIPRRQEPPRPFRLRWNSRKEPDSRRRSDEWQEVQGVRFTAHDARVQIALSNGVVCTTLEELEGLLARGGDYEIKWDDGRE